jgi:hypothetical protein
MTINTLRIAMVFSLILGASACSGLRDQGPRAAGLPFDARLAEGETRRDFTVRVLAPGVTLADARESARYEATRQCIEQTGFSTVDWVIDPATGDWAVARNDAGELIVSGRCADR